MKLTARNLHRDLAYFYVGLIIAFSFSGIFLNHRRVFNPQTYVSQVEKFKVDPISDPEQIKEDFVKNLSQKQQITDQMRRFRVEKNELLVSYVSTDLKLNLQTGEGTKETYKTIPLLGQMTKLHKDTSDWWIYYSDIFGVAMLTIAITGMFIARGKDSFRQRGWKFALVGLIFPLIFLFLLS